MSSVLDYLQGRGVRFTVIPHGNPAVGEPAPPAPDADGELVAKTVVVIANFGPALMVIPASRTLDMARTSVAVGDPEVRRATERELEQRFPDYDPEAVPPLSMLLLAPMYVDPAVADRDEIVFAAGRPDVSIRMATKDLFGTDPIVIAPITAESGVKTRS